MDDYDPDEREIDLDAPIIITAREFSNMRREAAHMRGLAQETINALFDMIDYHTMWKSENAAKTERANAALKAWDEERGDQDE